MVVHLTTDQFLYALRTILISTVYIVLSGGQIYFNKYLVNRKRFPHAMVLCTIHMMACWIFSNLAYFLKPSLLPGMQMIEGRRWELFKWFIPIGMCFAIMVYCSNMAYLYCNVAFLQFMKESNLFIVFLLSCIVGLQNLNRQRLVVISWVVIGSSFCVSGEVHFAFIGFIAQLIAQIAECTRAVMAECILSKKNMDIDPLTYNRYMAPICLVTLIIGDIVVWKEGTIADLKEWYPLIIPNAILAFSLNLVVAILIQKTSAVSFIISGVIKDMLIVIISSFVFEEEFITVRQWICFCVIITGCCFWGLMRIVPDHPLVLLFEKALCVYRDRPLPPTEKSVLFPALKTAV